jgi:sec-independent protein translocase protein TatC
VARVFRAIGHDDRLSIVDHLDELRQRLFVCLGVFVVAFGLCFWQNHHLLQVLDRSIPAPKKQSSNHLSGLTGDAVAEARSLAAMARSFAQLSASEHQDPSDRAVFGQLAKEAGRASSALPQTQPKNLPITIGIGEPFMTTLAISAYFALLFVLPVLLWQSYGFVLPALTREERSVALPMMLLAPALFIVGVVFTFFMILPPAVRFLQGFDSQNFDILLQARPFYEFEILAMAGVGLAFQMPIGLLALQRLGVINSRTLTRHWRYALVVISIIAAALPGPDPVTTGLETLPLLILYALSIVLLRIADRRAASRAERAARHIDDALDPT